MAQGTITATSKPIKWKRVDWSETLTLNADGYLSIYNDMPTGMNNFLFAQIESWTAAYPKAAFGVTCTGAYLIGSANMTISGLRIRYFYTD